MPSRASETLILRTYPYREADLVVNFFTREQGKLRGIAKGVRRPKNRFGSGLERLSHVKLFYFQKETLELTRLDRCELLSPPHLLRADYATGVALDFLVEVSDQMLPEHEPNDAFFRLLLLVLEEFRGGLNRPVERRETAATTDVSAPGGAHSSLSGGARSAKAVGVQSVPRGGSESEAEELSGRVWRAITYFALWAVRLGGWLPPLDVCTLDGAAFGKDEPVYFARSQPGLFSVEFRDRDSWPMSPDSRTIAQEMLRKRLPDLAERPWRRQTADDLRRFLIQRLEAQFEQRLRAAAVLAQL